MFVYWCTCVFVYFCICVFVYLYILVFGLTLIAHNFQLSQSAFFPFPDLLDVYLCICPAHQLSYLVDIGLPEKEILQQPEIFNGAFSQRKWRFFQYGGVLNTTNLMSKATNFTIKHPTKCQGKEVEYLQG